MYEPYTEYLESLRKYGVSVADLAFCVWFDYWSSCGELHYKSLSNEFKKFKII